MTKWVWQWRCLLFYFGSLGACCLIKTTLPIKYSSLCTNRWWDPYVLVQTCHFGKATEREGGATYINFWTNLLRPLMFLKGLIVPVTNLLMTTSKLILMNIIEYLKPTSPRRSMVGLFHYLLWNYWKSQNMVNFDNLSWPLEPVLLTQWRWRRTLVLQYPLIPGLQQILIPHSLRGRLWMMAHCNKCARLSGITQMHATLQINYYWPRMAANVTSPVYDCVHFAKMGLVTQES